MQFCTEYTLRGGCISKGYFSIFKNRGITNTIKRTTLKYTAWWIFTCINTPEITPQNKMENISSTSKHSFEYPLSPGQYFPTLFWLLSPQISFACLELHMNEITPYAFFCAWLFSPQHYGVHAAVCWNLLKQVETCLLVCFSLLCPILLYEYTTVFFPHSTLGGYVGYFQFGVLHIKPWQTFSHLCPPKDLFVFW